MCVLHNIYLFSFLLLYITKGLSALYVSFFFHFFRAFTQRAIRITSCINDTDKKKEDFAIESKENYKKNKNQKELGDYINHAGRLLMNHGCIDDAVKTKNKMFLDNGTVKDILNKMWYDTEELDYLTVS